MGIDLRKKFEPRYKGVVIPNDYLLRVNYEGTEIPIMINDEVIIHHRTGKYPGKIQLIKYRKETLNICDGIRADSVISVTGIRENHSYGGFWLHSYIVPCLEFVKRNCQD